MSFRIVNHISNNRAEELATLIRNAFKSYVNMGLHVTCAYYTVEDVQKILQSDYYLAALSDSNELVGFTSYYECAANVYNARVSAISPQKQKMGIGWQLQQERWKRLANVGCKYLISSTSVFEKPSIKWHLNKCHCHIIGFSSYKDTNYYSYIFREDILEKSTIIDVYVKYPCDFIRQFLRTILFWEKDGSYTKFGKLYFSIRNK